MKKVNKVRKWFRNNLEWLILMATGVFCVIFIIVGTTAEDGSITLDGSNAKISDSTKQFIEDAQTALNRIMNQDNPTDEETEQQNDENEVGLGFATSIDAILARRLPDGSNDSGKGFQCSKYTGYLGTGKLEYSAAHPDYGPVNGKDVTAWLVKNYGFKYIDTPVAGAIGSGGFNTLYGHTAMFLYFTGVNTAVVNDANYVPLTVSTHNMNIEGWVWVVPGDYTPAPTPSPEPVDPTPTPSSDTSEEEYVVKPGDTLGGILLAYGYTGDKLFGDDGLAQKTAEKNGITNRGLIYPNQTIVIYKSLFNV